MTIRAPGEVGLDSVGARSKDLDEHVGQPWDSVITVCDAAGFPVVPGRARRVHWPFDDPARAPGPPDAQIQVFRRVRDEIEEQVRSRLRTGLNRAAEPQERATR